MPLPFQKTEAYRAEPSILTQTAHLKALNSQTNIDFIEWLEWTVGLILIYARMINRRSSHIINSELLIGAIFTYTINGHVLVALHGIAPVVIYVDI